MDFQREKENIGPHNVDISYQFPEASRLIIFQQQTKWSVQIWAAL